jgi:PAS domain S-box-containing protein
MDPVHDPAFEATLLAQLPDAVIYAERAGAIRAWNDAATRLFGHSPAEAIGAGLDLIIPERFRPAHWKGFDASMASGTTKYAGQVLTTRAAHKDGSKVYVDMTFAIVKDARGEVIGATAVCRRTPGRA